MPFCYKSLFPHFLPIYVIFALLFYVEHFSLSYGVTLRPLCYRGRGGGGDFVPRAPRLWLGIVHMIFQFRLALFLHDANYF